MSQTPAAKVGTLTLRTDGDRIVGYFTDHEGMSTEIIHGRSLDTCAKAVQQMVLLMQRRNGIGNFRPNGELAEHVTESLIPDLMATAAADTGKGWGKWP